MCRLVGIHLICKISLTVDVDGHDDGWAMVGGAAVGGGCKCKGVHASCGPKGWVAVVREVCVCLGELSPRRGSLCGGGARRHTTSEPEVGRQVTPPNQAPKPHSMTIYTHSNLPGCFPCLESVCQKKSNSCIVIRERGLLRGFRQPEEQ